MNNNEPYTFFDRIAVAFGAILLGFIMALIAALPLFYVLGLSTLVDVDQLGPLLFWKLPIIFSLVSGVIAIINPQLTSGFFGSMGRIIIYIWSCISGR